MAKAVMKCIYVNVDKTGDAHRFAKKMERKPSVIVEMATDCSKMAKLVKRSTHARRKQREDVHMSATRRVHQSSVHVTKDTNLARMKSPAS
jgi:hypothetical protein